MLLLQVIEVRSPQSFHPAIGHGPSRKCDSKRYDTGMKCWALECRRRNDSSRTMDCTRSASGHAFDEFGSLGVYLWFILDGSSILGSLYGVDVVGKDLFLAAWKVRTLRHEALQALHKRFEVLLTSKALLQANPSSRTNVAFRVNVLKIGSAIAQHECAREEANETLITT